MARISRKKRLRRVSANKVVYLVVIILLIILIVLISRNSGTRDGIYIKKFDFIDVGNNVYLKFKINNPTEEKGSCLLKVTLDDKQYTGYANVSAKSKKTYLVPVDMPYGTIEVKINYTCV